MSLCPLPPDLSAWVLALATCLDARQHQRFAALLTGLLFARGRRTVTTWLRAGDLTHEFRQSYGLLARVGQRSTWLAVWLLRRAAIPLLTGGQDRLLFGLDDTPTRRYGPKVQGAGIHHNPTPGPAGAKFVYGHVWVI